MFVSVGRVVILCTVFVNCFAIASEMDTEITGRKGKMKGLSVRFAEEQQGETVHLQNDVIQKFPVDGVLPFFQSAEDEADSENKENKSDLSWEWFIKRAAENKLKNPQPPKRDISGWIKMDAERRKKEREAASRACEEAFRMAEENMRLLKLSIQADEVERLNVYAKAQAIGLVLKPFVFTEIVTGCSSDGATADSSDDEVRWEKELGPQEEREVYARKIKAEICWVNKKIEEFNNQLFLLKNNELIVNERDARRSLKLFSVGFDAEKQREDATQLDVAAQQSKDATRYVFSVKESKKQNMSVEKKVKIDQIYQDENINLQNIMHNNENETYKCFENSKNKRVLGEKNLSEVKKAVGVWL